MFRRSTTGVSVSPACAAAVLVLAGALAGCQRSPGTAPADATGAAAASGAAQARDGADDSNGAGATDRTAPTAAPGSGAARPDASGEARARTIRDAAAKWPKVEGRWSRGDTSSSYVAYFDGSALRYLEEQMNAGETGGRRANRYYFDDGALFYYDGEKPSSVPGGEGPGMLPPTVAVVAEFRGGDVVRAVAREHYGEKKLDDATVAGIVRHAAALAGAARDEWSAKQR